MKNWLKEKVKLYYYSEKNHENLNWITHAIGSVLSIIGLALCIIKSLSSGKGFSTSIFIYCLSMLVLYTASATYHKAKNESLKRFCRLIDHSGVYILIAGTYTPLLMYAGTTFFYSVLAIVWGLALTGITLNIVFWGKFEKIHLATYILLGWIVTIFAYKLFPLIPRGMIYFSIAGGITYTLGVIFYASKKIPYNHAIWHFFVLGGSIFFFLGIYIYLI